MRKNHLLEALLALGFFALSCVSVHSSEEKNGHRLIKLLQDAKYSEQQYKAFRELYFNVNQHKQLILEHLSKERNWSESWDFSLEPILFIMGVSGDHDYVKPMIKLIQDTEYTERACLYFCAIEFSLSLLCDEKDIAFLKELAESDRDPETEKYKSFGYHISDVVKMWEQFQKAKPETVEVRKERAKDALHFANMEIQEKYRRNLELSADELLEIAKDRRKSYEERYFSLTSLSYLVESENIIIDILALISLDPGFFDASHEFQFSGMNAIRNIFVQNGRNKTALKNENKSDK